MTTAARTALQYYVRHFPFKKGKNRVITTLWKPLSFRQFQGQTMLRQAEVRVNCDLTKLIQRHLFFWGSYEDECCELWIRLARRSRVIFDVGANIGLYSLLAAKVNPQSAIHAFEPTPAIVALLNENIRLNDMHNINVNAVGVGSRSEQAFLRECRGSDDSNEGMNFVVAGDVAPENGDFSIQIVSLQDYCRQHGIENVDILKMDIEGGEYEALTGAGSLLKSQSVGCLFIELIEWSARRSGHSTSELRNILQEAGYGVYRLSSGELKEVQREDILDGENIVACAPGFNVH